MKKVLSMIMLMASLLSCNTATSGNADKQRILVLYYSQTGATKSVAEEIQKQLDADIDSVIVENPYDKDFGATIARCQEEMKNNTLPKIKDLNVDLDKYDVIFLGYPVWFGTYARPISALVNNPKLSTKKIITFATFGSGGLNTSTNDLKNALPSADITEGYGVRNARVTKASEEVSNFLIVNGFIKGNAVRLEEFSKAEKVSDEEKAIFDEACSDYQFPLGSPKTFGKRNIKNGVEYKFDVESMGQNGENAKTTIYVVKENGTKAEFTQVVR